MADDQAIAANDQQPDDFGRRYQFHEVFQKEIALINRRRAVQPDRGLAVDVEVRRRAGEIAVDIEVDERPAGIASRSQGRRERGEIRLEVEAPADVTGQPVLVPAEDANVVGLALSGGGVRSAAFCLGVLQALHEARVLDSVDYMSTVSGGGYIGCSLTAALEASGEEGGPPVFPFPSRLMENEPPALQQIRNYSNYLFPRGAIDVLHNSAIYARGLVVNAVLLAPFLFGASALTLVYYSLHASKSGGWLRKLASTVLNHFGLRHFFLTIDLAIVLVILGVVWGIVRSTRRQQAQFEIPSRATKWVGTLVIAFFGVLFCDLQPFMLDAMRAASGNLVKAVTNWINAISAVLAPVGAAMAFLANKLGEYVKSVMQTPSTSAQVKAFATRAAIYGGGLILPLAIWMIYLDVTYWGVCVDVPPLSCPAPWWLANAAQAVAAPGYAVAALYGAAAIACFTLSLFMRPNANSLHPLYRDRLRRAFLFAPQAQLGKDDLPIFCKPFSKITGLHGPYPLINAALNVEASKTANRRARNADFFLFSPRFVGSKSTGYVATRDVEQVAIGFDLATAMAASGAAVSSEMGAKNVKPLAATLALLNIRLGYWLRNPRWLAKARPPRDRARPSLMSDYRRRNNLLANYYFLAEMLGLLSDEFKSVYLTDGGHIENLGIYELLKRRCRIIIAVDAEADPQMAFASFNTLERYALIDLGIRIDLPWQQIADKSLGAGKDFDDKGDAPKDHGPHCAIGEIRYPSGHTGVLIYIKASLTGDENDTVIDYKKRYGDFPHETTLDQMFSEEQFEAYRALGFHAAYNLFDRCDRFAHLNPAQNTGVRPQLALLDALFPRASTEGAPGQKQTFAAWLPPTRTRRPPKESGRSKDI